MKKIIAALCFIAVLATCTNKELEDFTVPPSSPTSSPKKMSGKIHLPSGSSINTNGLSVRSLIEESQITNGVYEIDSNSVRNYSTLFVTNTNDDPLMMLFAYPGQKNYDITSESTALAMLMNVAAMESLTLQGKLNLINKITLVPSFTRLVDEISKSLIVGRSFADTNNLQLVNAFTELFRVASTENIEDLNHPVSFSRLGRRIELTNNGSACSYGIGVYKDDQLVGRYVLDGREMFASSFPDLIKGIFTTYDPQLITRPFDLIGDGKFEIKINSGRKWDKSFERDTAVYENLFQGALTSINLVLPLINKGCLNLLKIKLVDIVKGVVNTKFSSPSPNPTRDYSLFELGLIVHDLKTSAIQLAVDFVSQCVDPKFEANAKAYLKTVLIYLKALDYINRVGAALNLGARTYYFVNALPTIDTCFTVTGNNIQTCATPKLAGSKYLQVSWRFESVPGYVNIAASCNPPIPAWTDAKILTFVNSNTYTISVTDSTGKVTTVGPVPYSIGPYYPDSLFLTLGPGYDCTISYGRQYTEGWGTKIPPGYDLKLGEFWPTRISLDGRQIYSAQGGDAVYIKQ